MRVILSLWMDVILLLTLQRDIGQRSRPEGCDERFNERPDEASRRSGRSAL